MYDEHRALTVRNEGVAVWSDDLCDLVCLGAAHDRQLHRFVAVVGQEPGDTGAGGHRVDVHIGVTLLPLLDSAVQFVVRVS
jgi:hypothetical protein